jgi:3-hydroxybutyryl-CoA dehydrogenase
MKILIIGDQENLTECELKFGNNHQYSWVADHSEAEEYLSDNDIVFDFIIDEEPDQLDIYQEKKIAVFLNSCKISLAELANMIDNDVKHTMFGFNGLPTLLNRSLLEVSLLNKNDTGKLEKICKKLNTEFIVVDDRVGMVTPRVLSMIINEAYYTVQEGTATREDINLAMKLGTNYPYGPFEWCQRIGIHHIFELLEAIYEDTKDDRYKICSLLKKEYLKLKC